MANYVVLARRWRPRSFDTLIGQEHVTRALVNALESGRLSHAFLFSGIRGTGKTTLARLLALCLNCEQGTSSKPCGQCGSCTEIIAGNHPDVLEVDAASRTKVEQMRELLDMVGYAPTSSRFRIFILDEVHMLSVPSFNALLKTLEEPPGHVKFLFATTELRKLPATILSRCQRYELKRVPEGILSGHMAWILEKEGISFEKRALELVAQAAEGSVRDALSLLDQVISHGGGAVAYETVGQLLGMTNREASFVLLGHLLAGAGKELLDTLAEIHQIGVEPESVVRDILELLHTGVRAKVTRSGMEKQQTSGFSDPWFERIRAVSLEHLQMVYMVLNKGGNDLRLTDHPWRALEMLLVRACYLAPVPDIKKLIRVLEKESAQGGGGMVSREGSAVSHGSPGLSSVPVSAPVSVSVPVPVPVPVSLPIPMQVFAAPVMPPSSPGHFDRSQSFAVDAERFPADWDQLIVFIRSRQPELAMKLHGQLACLRYQLPVENRPGSMELQLINDCFGSPQAIRDRVAAFIRQHFDVHIDIVVSTHSACDRPETLQEREVREQVESSVQLGKEIDNYPGIQSLRARFNVEILSIVPKEHRIIH